MDNLTFSENEIFERIVEEGLFQGITGEEAYGSLVEEVVNDMLNMGELDPDQNTVGHVDHLKARYSEYEKRMIES